MGLVNDSRVASHAAESLLHAWASQIDAGRAQTREAIATLTHEFSGIVSGIDQILEQSGHSVSDWQTDIAPNVALIRQQLDHCLHHLQFQDRIDQVMGHVQESVAQLANSYAEQARGSTAEIDFAGILASLVHSYTMREEVARHEAKPITNDGDELTYF